MLTGEIEKYIEEDQVYLDIASSIIPSKKINAVIFTKQECTIAGIEEVKSIFYYFGIEYSSSFTDGDYIGSGDIIFRLYSDAASILRAERIVLNFLGHLSGIATLTRSCVSRIENISSAKIACTRKTVPGIRRFEKAAVVAGGGDPHRFSLSDTVMVKDNHIKLMGLEEVIVAARKHSSFVQKLEVEVESEKDAVTAAELGADIIMLDNMDPGLIIRTLQTLKRKGLRDHVIIEASGGIHQGNLEEYAKTGVDVISMGSLVYDAGWIDVSLEILIDTT